MKKLTIILSYLVTALAACTLTLAITQKQSAYSKLDQLHDVIEARFIGEYDDTAINDAAADAMVKALGDRWSYYIPADEYADYLERVQNSYVGIGITITRQEEPAGLHIESITPGGSAEAAGILPNDLIVSIDGHSTEEMSPSDARDLVRGKEGTSLRISILRGEETLEFTVERKKIETPVTTFQMLDNRIGLITIANFDDRCAEESIAAIHTLQEQGAEKLIFDVRYNPGGYAHELVKLLDFLLPEGELFRTVNYQGKETVDKSDASFLDMPIAVLCNADSYSAAEFFAAAIQEYEAGIIVGQQTFGKGYFQTTIPLLDGSAVGLSIGKYFTPKGNSLIGTGIVPDIVIEVDQETAAGIYYKTLDPKDDPQIQAAVEALGR